MIVWLSSYPRSGNTFFRVILNTVFNIKTYSIYNDTGDIGADEATTEIVGHSFLPKDFDLDNARASKEVYYIKTHELLENMVLDSRDKVIYLVRDGRESTLSFTKHLQNFFKKEDDDLSDVIYGNTPFGSWGEHVKQWSTVDKLLIKFEKLIDDPSSILNDISVYLNIQPLNNKIPTFQELQKINPKFFRSGKKDTWKHHFSKDQHLTFWLRNVNEMTNIGYTDNMPAEVEESSFQTYSTLFNKEIEALKMNTFKDRLITQKLKTQEEKNKILQKDIGILGEKIENLIQTKFIRHPVRKYRKYKELTAAWHKLPK